MTTRDRLWSTEWRCLMRFKSCGSDRPQTCSRDRGSLARGPAAFAVRRRKEAKRRNEGLGSDLGEGRVVLVDLDVLQSLRQRHAKFGDRARHRHDDRFLSS